MRAPRSRPKLGDMRAVALALLPALLLASASAAFAQTAAPRGPQTVDAGTRGPIQLGDAQAPAAGESVVVEELEVIAQAPGPAMWTVSRGDSQVVILGGYAPLPHQLDWDHRRLDRALTGAGGFYEARATTNPLEAAGLFLDQGALKLGGGRSLDSVIGPVRRERLGRVAAIAHADLGRMQPFKPAVAGILAYQTFLRTVGLSAEKPGSTVRRRARDLHVPVRPLARLGAASVIRSIQNLGDAGQLACFDAALDQIEWESSHAIAAAQAWAKGDLKGLRTARSNRLVEACLSENGRGRAVLDKGVADASASIDELLSRPGRSVALIDMRFLTSRDGVLDRLKAKGAEIGVPRD